VTREDATPVVTRSSTPGAPIVTSSTRPTGQQCIKNPSTAAERGNSC